MLYWDADATKIFSILFHFLLYSWDEKIDFSCELLSNEFLSRDKLSS